MPRLRIKKAAKARLAALPDWVQRAVDDALLDLQANPADVGQPLRGIYAGRWRMAVGQVRIIYRLRENGNLVVVEAVRHRGTAYKRAGS